MLKKIDDFLIDAVFQPISDWFVNKSGKNLHWLTVCLIYLFGTLLIWETIKYPPQTLTEPLFDTISLIFIIIVSINIEKKARSHKIGFVNKNRYDHTLRLIRIVLLLYFLIQTTFFYLPWVIIEEHVITCVRLCILSCAFYLEACETKPPSQPKVTGAWHLSTTKV